MTTSATGRTSVRLFEFRKHSLCLYLTLVLIASFTITAPLSQAQTVKLTDMVTVFVPEPWRNVPTKVQNMAQLELLSGKESGHIDVRTIVSYEVRFDHAGAIRRLHEIETEREGTIRFLEIAGWPAIERIYSVGLSNRVNDDESQLQRLISVRTTAVTVAICVNNIIVRYEGTLDPKAQKRTEDVLRLADGMRTGTKPDKNQTRKDIDDLRKRSSEKRRPVAKVTMSAKSAAIVPPGPPEDSAEMLRKGRGSSKMSSFGLTGIGEVQIAASPDGKNVVLGTNHGISFSTNFGATYTPASSINWGSLGTMGDPSVGVGFSGNFYFSTLGVVLPNPSTPAGCTVSVARSTDQGANFNFVGHAEFCKETGIDSCSPDQEQMAVDHFHTPAGLDQLYMVWRDYLPDDDTTKCTDITGRPLPVLSCSEDSGVNWPKQQLVGTGDLGRITVASDGFVYITYISGSNLMINKFSSCAQGLQPQQGFPVTIASINGVQCPVPGLDRCSTNSLENDAMVKEPTSPQPAVDETNTGRVFVAYADSTGGGNENIVLKESVDGGLTWPITADMNPATTARRFMPWVCTTQGTVYVSWYDRSVSTPTASDLTAYFLNTATEVGSSLTVSPTPRNVSGSGGADAQCASGWPRSVDDPSDQQGCPASAPQNAGICFPASGPATAPFTFCNLNAPVCPTGSSCGIAGGCPKYGDYNGNACSRGAVYVGWASATPPSGVGVPTPPMFGCGMTGINVFTDHFNFPACGAAGQACCFQGGAACSSSSLACDSTNTCVACGGPGQPCCGAPAAACNSSSLVCSNGQCQCGGPGQPCCSPNSACQAGLSCDGGSNTCACGGLGQYCCNQTSGGGSCSNNLVCDVRSVTCITSCGHIGQACCANDLCNFGGTCSGGVCECGGLNEACCAPGATCKNSLICSAGFCTTSSSTCGTCTINKQTCKSKCAANDTYCQCLCDNSYCGCTNGTCGPCTFQSCTRP